MGDWSLGSVATEVIALVDNVPTSISGTPLEGIADRERQFVQDYTSTSIGSNSIGIMHQGVILNYTISETLCLMNTIGIDATSIRLGDFSENKGGQTNIKVTAAAFKLRADEMLNNLGTKISFHKALG